MRRVIFAFLVHLDTGILLLRAVVRRVREAGPTRLLMVGPRLNGAPNGSSIGFLAEFEGNQFSHFKAVLTDLAVAALGPMGAEMKRLTADPGQVDAVLAEGAARAQAIAEPILAEVRDIVGFLQPGASA